MTKYMRPLHRRLGLWWLMPLTTIYSVISWRSVLLVEETGVPGETTDMSEVTDKLYHIMLYRIHLAMSRIQTHNVNGDRVVV